MAVSCNPARKLEKQEAAITALKAKWVAEWEKDHPCNPMPDIDLDSLCSLYGPTMASTDKNGYEAGDSDTNNGKGPHNAPVYKTTSHNNAGQPKRILVPWHDDRREKLLSDSCQAKDIRIAKLDGQLSEANKQCITAKADAKRSNRYLWLYLIISVLLNVLLLVLLFKKKT